MRKITDILRKSWGCQECWEGNGGFLVKPNREKTFLNVLKLFGQMYFVSLSFAFLCCFLSPVILKLRGNESLKVEWAEKGKSALLFSPSTSTCHFLLFCVFKHLNLGCIKSRHSCCVLLQSISKSILWLQCWYWCARKEGGIDSGEYEYLKLDGRRLHSGDRKEQHYCWKRNH